MLFLEFLKDNIATIIILAILALIVSLIVIKMIKNKRNGVSSCGCGCSTCPMGGKCNSKKTADQKAIDK